MLSRISRIFVLVLIALLAHPTTAHGQSAAPFNDASTMQDRSTAPLPPSPYRIATTNDLRLLGTSNIKIAIERFFERELALIGQEPEVFVDNRGIPQALSSVHIPLAQIEAVYLYPATMTPRGKPMLVIVRSR